MKIMVVDDEVDIQMLFEQRFMKEIKFEKVKFHFALSAESALEYLKASGTSDLRVMFSDINMPGMNGLELLQAVKEEFPSIHVSMITAYSNQYYETAMEYGAEKYYTKPLDFSALKQDILKG